MHNYVKKLDALARAGALSTMRGLVDLQITHDDWCLIFTGGECNCDPNLRFTTGVTVEELVRNSTESAAKFKAFARSKRQ